MTIPGDPLERWPQLDELFERALEVAPAAREALLVEAAETDPELRTEIERLLVAHDGSGDFLENPGSWIGELPTSPDVRGGLAGLGGLGENGGIDGPIGSGGSGGSDLDDSIVGTTVGHFQILDRLGAGGMGVVYKARDTRLDRLVALKFLNPPAQAIPEASERLLREARAASALDHPNVCTIHEIGETADGRLYVAMAYYAGETLRQRLAKGALDASEVLDIGIKIGRGLACAHAAGIVHRDLKPGNVMLTDDGEVKVLDFGIAKRAGTSNLTGTSVRLGTVTYMSPEQAQGGPIDPRTDVWSLGATLYRSASGRLPFEADTDLAALDAILRTEPPPLDSGLPGLDAVVRRALAKDPDQRYQRMDDMVADLRALVRGEATLAGAVNPKRNRPVRRSGWVPAAAVAAVAAVIASGYALMIRTDESAGDPILALPQGPTIAVVPFENLGPDASQEYFAKGLTEDLITSLGRFSDLFVLASAATAPYGGPTPDVGAIGRELNADYAMVGTVQQQEGRVRVTVRLLDTATQNAAWSENFDHDLSAAGLFAVQDEVTQRVAGTVGGSGGLIGRRLATDVRRGRTERLDSYQCVLRSYDYLINHSPTNHVIARECLEDVVAVDSGYVDAWGWLAYIYAEESRHAWNRRAYDPLERALATAERATRMEPTNFIGQASMAVTRFGRHEVGLFVEAAERAMALNPNDATWLAVFGGYLVEIGEWDRGIAILDKARALNPNHPSWLFGDYALNEYRQGNYDEALAFALRINLPDYYRGFIWQVATYGQVGRTAEARAVYDRVLELRPDLVDEESIRRDFEQYNHSDDVLDHVFEGMWKAGIWDR